MSKGLRTREQILSQSVLLFAKHGYENTSFQMIAEKCDVSRAAPLYHFKTKFGLFEAIVRHLQKKKMDQILDPNNILITDNGFEKLRKFFKGTVGWTLISTSEAEIFLLLYYFAAHDKLFASLYQEILADEQKCIEGFLLAGKREGHFQFSERSEVLASMIHDLLVGFSVNSLAGRHQVYNMTEVDRKLMKLLEKLTGYEEKDG